MALAPSSYGQGERLASAIRPVLETLENRRLLSVGLPNEDGTLAIDGTAGDDAVLVRPDAKGGVKVLFNEERHVFDPGSVKQIVFDGGDGDDTFKVLNLGGQVGVKIIAHGGAGDDVLSGGARNDQLFGEEGDDVIAGQAGHDLIDGGAGDDTLLAGRGADKVLGQTGDDSIIKGGGRDDIQPGAGANEISNIRPAFPITTYTIDPAGYTPRMQRYAYGLGSLDDRNYTNRGQGQAIAIVGAFDLPTVRDDLRLFARDMSLPGLSSKQLRIVNLAPKKRRLVDEDWNGEAMLDVQWAHAIAPKARIYMVQAATNAPADMFAAVEKAKRLLNNGFGGGVISMSWGNYIDSELRRIYESTFRGPASRYISYVASSGDIGGINAYPNTSPNVVSVGGTALYLDQYGNRVAGAASVGVDTLTNIDVWGTHHMCGEETGLEEADGDFDRNIFPGGEVAWWEGSGGPSNVFDIPRYQENRDVSDGVNRGTPDVAWNGDPATGVPVYNSLGGGGVSGWGTTGGTSAGAPQFAAMVALANQRRAERGNRPVGSTLLDRIYRMAGRGADRTFYDVGNPSGLPEQYLYHGNGPIGNPCDLPNNFVNPALPGWDFATGWGTPNGSAVIPNLADERVPLTSGRVRINGNFTDEIAGSGLEWIGFNGTTRAAGYGTITMQSMITTRLYRSVPTGGGGVEPVTNSLFFVDIFGHDDQDGRADENGAVFVAQNGVVTSLTLSPGTGTPVKLYKHGRSVQGQAFLLITEAPLGDDQAGQPDPDTFIRRSVPIRFVGRVGKNGAISGEFFTIGPNGERVENRFDPNSTEDTLIVRGEFEWD